MPDFSVGLYLYQTNRGRTPNTTYIGMNFLSAIVSHISIYANGNTDLQKHIR